MAKALQRTMPTSSVANLLDPGVSAQVLSRAESQTRTPPSRAPLAPVVPMDHTLFQMPANTMQPTGEVPSIPRQFTLTASTDRTLKRIVDTFTDATGLELRHSELLRAILHAAAAAMPELHEEARKIGPLRRPKNERGREAQREAVERRIARAFAAALRAAPAEG